MTDEKFTFIQDCRDKKHTARSYSNRVTHGGKVRLPSDHLTQKELRQMSGEVKSYRMNEPMKWKEFKAMPEDLQKAYILAIRSKYRVSDTKIFVELFGISQSNGKKVIAKLGIGTGRGVSRGEPDLEGWRKWLRGTDEPEEVVESVVEQEAEPFDEFEEEPIVPAEPARAIFTDGFAEKVAEAFAKVSESTKKVGMALNSVCDRLEEAVAAEKTTETITPVSGSLTFDGSARQALDTIGMILKDANVRLTVTWCVADGDV